MRSWMHLPGPRAFIGRLISDLQEGCSVMLDGPERTTRKIVDHVWEDRRLDLSWHRISGHAESPVAELSSTGGSRDDRGVLAPAELYDIPTFSRRVFVVADLPKNRAEEWFRFTQEFAHVSRSRGVLERSVLLIALPNELARGAPEDVLLVRRACADIADELDARLFAQEGIRRHGSALSRELCATLCAELALWDLDLCGELAQKPVMDLTNPVDYLRGYATRLGWDRVANDASPVELTCLGIRLAYGGRDCEHTAWHALRGNVPAIMRRVWRAEIKVLLPFVEEQRRIILEKGAHLLRVPHTRPDGTKVGVVEDLEIGDIFWQFQNGRFSRRLQAHLKALRAIRNSLAHGEPVESRFLQQGVLDCETETML